MYWGSTNGIIILKNKVKINNKQSEIVLFIIIILLLYWIFIIKFFLK